MVRLAMELCYQMAQIDSTARHVALPPPNFQHTHPNSYKLLQRNLPMLILYLAPQLPLRTQACPQNEALRRLQR